MTCTVASDLTDPANPHQPLLDAHTVAYQMKSVDIITQPTLWYAAIAGLWQRQTPPELTLETVFGHAVKKKILPAGENEVHFFPRKT